MSSIVLIDSSCWVAAYRRNPPEQIADRLTDLMVDGAAGINDLIRMEILVGARSQDDFNRIAASVTGASMLRVIQATWISATEIGYALRREGITVGLPDLLVAASAIEHDAVLMHADRDFDLIAKHSDLKVESYVDIAI